MTKLLNYGTPKFYPWKWYNVYILLVQAVISKSYCWYFTCTCSSSPIMCLYFICTCSNSLIMYLYFTCTCRCSSSSIMCSYFTCIHVLIFYLYTCAYILPVHMLIFYLWSSCPIMWFISYLHKNQSSSRWLLFLHYTGDYIFCLGKLGCIVIDVLHPNFDFCVITVVAIINCDVQLV